MRLATLALCFVPAFLACAATVEAPRVPVQAQAPRVLGTPAVRYSTLRVDNYTENELAVYLSPVTRTRLTTVRPFSKACVPMVGTSGAVMLVARPLGGGRRHYSPRFEIGLHYVWKIRTSTMEYATDLWSDDEPCAEQRA